MFKIPSILRSLFAPALVAMACLFLVNSPASANVVRPAPNFTWINYSGSAETLKRFQGQPVVLLVAPSPRSWAFRSQVGQLQKVFQRLSATGAVCVAAFTRDTGRIRSNIPFALAQDGPRVAYDYGIEDSFSIAIIGWDGNLDLITNRVTSGQRVLDVVGNSFAVQEALRRD